MAELTPYRDNITPELGPNTGTDAMISAARRVGPLEREAGLMVQQGAAAIGQAAKDVFAQREAVQTRREIASGLESHALIQGQQEADLNRLLSDPELSKDPNKLQAALKQIQSETFDQENADWVSKNFTTQAGQEWAQLHAAQQSAELVKHGFSMADIISSNEAITSAFNAANQYAANAIANPMTIDQQIASYRSGVQGIASTIADPVKRAEFEKAMRKSEGDIAYAGVHSAIENNPSLGRQLAQKYGSVMTPEHQTAASSYADAVTKANAQQARIDRSMNRQDEHDAADQFANNITLKLYSNGGKVPADFMNDMVKLSSMRVSPGTFHLIMAQKDQMLKEAARGEPTATDSQVYADFARRAALPQDDPQHLTDAEIAQSRINNQLSDHDASMFKERVDVAAKDPAVAQDQKTLNKYLELAKPPNITGSAEQNNAYLTFVKDRSDKFWYGRSQGISADDLTNPQSKSFIGFMSDADKATAASATQRQATTVFQKQTQSAVTTAMTIVGLVRDNNPELAKRTLEQEGISGANVDGGAWCAPLVNKALAAVGLQGTGSGLASSFKTWGFPVQPADVKPGDVFYEPAEGYTGHVGLLTGATRVSGGVPQVQVVSSHLEGDPSNPGGIEWRDARPMVFRRAQAPLDQITPGATKNAHWWNNLFGRSAPAPSASAPIPPATEVPPTAGEQMR